MAASDWVELRSALTGTLRFACGDRSALRYFDRSLDGFWRSFRAAFLAYPLYLLLLTMRTSFAQWQSTGGWTIIGIETIAYVITWTAFPLIMLRFTRWLGREEHFFDFMVPYNWCQLPQSFLAVVIGIEAGSGLFSVAAIRLVDFVGAIAILVYEWFVARVALQTTRGMAALVVAIDLLLAVVVARAAAGLY